jgi:two-component system, OmpR family, response regulator
MRTRNTLIVEDHEQSAAALRRLLCASGFHARVAGTVAAARESLASGWPQSVVLDLCLPDGSGVELLRTIRRRGPAVRVAVATGSADDAMLREVKRLRADAVFVKPLWAPALLEWLGRGA